MSRFLVLALLVMLTLFISILVAQFVTTGQRAAIGLVLDVAGLTFIGLPFFRRLRVFHSLAFSGSVSDWPRAHERAALVVDPTNVVYRREAGATPPMPPCGRRAL